MKLLPPLSIASAVVLLILYFTPCALAQPTLDPQPEQQPASATDETTGEPPMVPASCIGQRDGLLQPEQASQLAALICQSVTNNGLPTGEVAQETGSPTRVEFVVTMNQDGEVIVDWKVTDAGALLGSGQETYRNYNEAYQQVDPLAKSIVAAKRGRDLSAGLDQSLYYTTFGVSGVYVVGLDQWGIGIATSATGHIYRLVLRASGRTNFNPSGGLFTAEGALEAGALILSFDEHVLWATGGVGLNAILAGGEDVFSGNLTSTAGFIATLAAGVTF